MKIEIDTKEDLHNMRHIIQLLHAISVNASISKKTPGIFDEESSGNFGSLFGDSNSSSTSSTPSSSSTGMFNMFDSSQSSTIDDKKDEDKKDLMDSLQVY